MDESTEAALVGQTIAGKFFIESFIGGGAMGAVYKARQISLDKIIAIKVMHPERARDSMYAVLFQREAKAASRLDHPNSVRVLDFGQEPDGLLYIAMEHFAGRDLHRVLADDWPLSTSRIADILSQALAALAVAHEMGIVHRDLKPENILVQKGTDDEGTAHDLVKVCDFGIAKLTETGDSAVARAEPRLTEGVVIGTPHYMSPEQGRGESLDARTDIYSIGIILYQLLTGHVPFEGTSLVDVVVKHVRDEPVPPTSLAPGADPRLEAICLKALRKKREDRQQSAREMRAELRAILAPPSSETAPPPPVDKEAATWPPEPPNGPALPLERTMSNVTPAPTSVIPEKHRRIRKALLLGTAMTGLIAGVSLVVAPRLALRRSTVSPMSSAAAGSAAIEPQAPGPPPATVALEPAVEAVDPVSDATSAVPVRAPAPALEPGSATTEGARAAAVPLDSLREDALPMLAPPPSAEAPVAAAPAEPTFVEPLGGAATGVNDSPPAAGIAPPAPSGNPATPSASATATATEPRRSPPAFDPSRGRVDWAVTATGGGATAAEVRRAFSRVSGVWSLCYKRALRATGQRVDGSGNLHVLTDEVGNVIQATLSGFEVRGLEPCIAAAARVRIAGVDTGRAWADVKLAFRAEPSE